MRRDYRLSIQARSLRVKAKWTVSKIEANPLARISKPSIGRSTSFGSYRLRTLPIDRGGLFRKAVKGKFKNSWGKSSAVFALRLGEKPQ